MPHLWFLAIPKLILEVASLLMGCAKESVWLKRVDIQHEFRFDYMETYLARVAPRHLENLMRPGSKYTTRG